MTEDEFWKTLEFRICRELHGMNDKHLKYMWCDGIHSDFARPQDGQNYLSGDIWIGPEGQTKMRFTMMLPEKLSANASMPWKHLLPPDNVTAWLLVDTQRQLVKIDLSKAEPV